MKAIRFRRHKTSIPLVNGLFLLMFGSNCCAAGYSQCLLVRWVSSLTSLSLPLAAVRRLSRVPWTTDTSPNLLQRCSRSVKVTARSFSADERLFSENSATDIQERLNFLQTQIDALNGSPLNVRSPIQVSRAIFGCIKSATKKELADAVEATELGSKQRQLASTVLEHRVLSAKLRALVDRPLQTSQQTRKKTVERSFSSQAEEDSVDEFSEEQFIYDHSYSPSLMTEKNCMDEHAYAKKVEALFETKGRRISEYWKQPLLELSRQPARVLVRQLNPSICPMGFDPQAGPYAASPKPLQKKDWAATFLGQCRKFKMNHADCMLLTRCGDFYEAYGLDAIMLVEHVGLNPMGGKAKAGCPKGQIQTTLDRLTAEGFSVAIVEEREPLDIASSKIKDRFLTQIVSPASPTYLYDLNMKDLSPEDRPSSRPYVGVLDLSAGYTIVEVYLEDQNVHVLERLTAHSLAGHLAANPPAEPLWYVPSRLEYESGKRNGISGFLPTSSDARDWRIKRLDPTRMPDVTAERTEADRAASFILSAVLEEGKYHLGTNIRPITAHDFTRVQQQKSGTTNPLHYETAKQLGVIYDKAIPSLLSHVLPTRAPAGTKHMIKTWLLTPPPQDVAEALASLVQFVQETDSGAFPRLMASSVGRLRSLLRTGQANAHVYAEIFHSLTSTSQLLSLLQNRPNVLESLLTVLEYQTGLARPDPAEFRVRCDLAANAIRAVIVSDVLENRENEADQASRFSKVPNEFWLRNECDWRGRVQRSAAPKAYDNVEMAARELESSVTKDFHQLEVVHDGKHNILYVKGDGKLKGLGFRHPFGLKNSASKYTTDRVEQCLSEYLNRCEKAREEVSSVLKKLSCTLHENDHEPAIVQAAYAQLIMSTVRHHAINALTFGWNRAVVTYTKNGREAGTTPVLHLKNVWPYYMHRKDAVGNDIDMSGMWVLTAPNMSGKSTLMRSIASAALLSICGLCAPLDSGSHLSNFDSIFVRGASSDVPSEGKSAFGAEMGDVASLLHSCSNQSLVFVDELGRGTSPMDGTALAGGVLEAMATAGMTGIFATHLHDILNLPIQGKHRILTKRMASTDSDGDGGAFPSYSHYWPYKLEDGMCRDSMAFVTAKQFGVPSQVLKRANDFRDYLNSNEKQSLVVNERLEDQLNESQPRSQPSNRPIDIILDLAKTLTTGTNGCHFVPAECDPPVFLTNKSCLYILEIPNHGSGFSYYIGETDNFLRRLQSHRQSKGTQLFSYVMVASDKTQAREWETRLIRHCERAGISLATKKDGGNSVRP